MASKNNKIVLPSLHKIAERIGENNNRNSLIRDL